MALDVKWDPHVNYICFTNLTHWCAADESPAETYSSLANADPVHDFSHVSGTAIIPDCPTVGHELESDKVLTPNVSRCLA